MRYHQALTRMQSEHRMTEIKKTDNTVVDEDTEQLKFSYVVGGDVKWYNLENSLAIFEEVKYTPTTWSGYSTPRYLAKRKGNKYRLIHEHS